MRIVNLIENTEGSSGCAAAHGLSFYIRTERHRILMDLGPSGDILRNAERLGIDLGSVDTVVLSHGHYDHTGGLLPFAKLNPSASVYLQRSALGEYYSADGPDTCPRYIGMDPASAALPQLVPVEGDLQIDEELRLLTVENRRYPVPPVNGRLKEKQGDSYVPDGFRHEQSLVVTEGGRSVLLSGCAHNGIRNILEEYRRKLGTAPDAVISGFHLMKKTDYSREEIREIRDTAEDLKRIPARFYTCHCTGIPAYEIMKEILGDQLSYVHSGDAVTFSP